MKLSESLLRVVNLFTHLRNDSSIAGGHNGLDNDIERQVRSK